MPAHCNVILCLTVFICKGFQKTQKKKHKCVVAAHRIGWEPKQTYLVCSSYLNPEEFDRTGQTMRLKENVTPSLSIHQVICLICHTVNVFVLTLLLLICVCVRACVRACEYIYIYVRACVRSI